MRPWLSRLTLGYARLERADDAWCDEPPCDPFDLCEPTPPAWLDA
jgi:hypothetical protein